MSEILCEGKAVRLRRVRPEDAGLVAAWKQDPVVRDMALGRSSKATPDNQRDDIERAVRSESELYGVIEVRETNRPVGYIRVNWMDEDKETAWLRFALGEERGRGRAKDALGAFLDHLFEEGLHRVDAEAYEFNEVSLGLLRKLGFVDEGRKREAHHTGERWVDVVALGLLRRDYLPPR